MFEALGITLVLGVGVGLATGGRLGNLAWLHVRLVPAAIGSAVIALLPLFITLPSEARRAIQILTMLGVLAFLAVNVPRAAGVVRAGFLLLALGWALNFTVIAANGAMPLSLWAYERSGLSETPTPGEGGFFKLEIADDATLMKPLGDVIPFRPLRKVFSPGDLFLMAGVAVVVAGGTRLRAPAPAPAESVLPRALPVAEDSAERHERM